MMDFQHAMFDYRVMRAGGEGSAGAPMRAAERMRTFGAGDHLHFSWCYIMLYLTHWRFQFTYKNIGCQVSHL